VKVTVVHEGAVMESGNADGLQEPRAQRKARPSTRRNFLFGPVRFPCLAPAPGTYHVWSLNAPTTRLQQLRQLATARVLTKAKG
jgi:hypothetical protein